MSTRVMSGGYLDEEPSITDSLEDVFIDGSHFSYWGVAYTKHIT